MKKYIAVMAAFIIVLQASFLATTVFADVLGDDETPTISGDEYNSAQNGTKNNIVNTNNKVNVSNNSALPQTGIEDSGMGILLIVSVAFAIFAYKKVSDYRNI